MSLAALYAKVNHTEPPVLRALVQGSAPRLKPVRAAVGQRESLPGWSLRMVDGNHLPGSEKRQAPLRSERGERGAYRALPWWCTIPMRVGSRTSSPARTPTKASARQRPPWWRALALASCGLQTAISVPALCCKAGRRPRRASSCANPAVLRSWSRKVYGKTPEPATPACGKSSPSACLRMNCGNSSAFG